MVCLALDRPEEVQSTSNKKGTKRSQALNSDFFVLFGSFAAAFSNPGQAIALHQHKQSDGSPEMLDDANALELLTKEIGRAFCAFMVLSEEYLDVRSSLGYMSLDSPVAIQFRNWWSQTLGVEISVLEILSAGTVEKLGGKAVVSLRQKNTGVAIEMEISNWQDEAILLLSSLTYFSYNGRLINSISSGNYPQQPEHKPRGIWTYNLSALHSHPLVDSNQPMFVNVVTGPRKGADINSCSLSTADASTFRIANHEAVRRNCMPRKIDLQAFRFLKLHRISISCYTGYQVHMYKMFSGQSYLSCRPKSFSLNMVAEGLLVLESQQRLLDTRLTYTLTGDRNKVRNSPSRYDVLGFNMYRPGHTERSQKHGERVPESRKVLIRSEVAKILSKWRCLAGQEDKTRLSIYLVDAEQDWRVISIAISWYGPRAALHDGEASKSTAYFGYNTCISTFRSVTLRLR
ncbi:hypothetical protein L249_5765 [Ophiocordyceps polyrhachis-furcata BCC 54312]|uniref:Uncharacterized protein n=1 Tax=Ophiocordyceps polyrhachis-furcata BCC 54312 TaxID=1330021 RepID=A0A367KZZ1_9HYPO|nr:hypothetical protein L249_5765 [Ophiocordyceps polyrhachis-furcata BCC 54312]